MAKDLCLMFCKGHAFESIARRLGEGYPWCSKRFTAREVYKIQQWLKVEGWISTDDGEQWVVEESVLRRRGTGNRSTMRCLGETCCAQ